VHGGGGSRNVATTSVVVRRLSLPPFSRA